MENSEKKYGKGMIITVAILWLVVLGLGGWLVYEEVISKNVKPTNENNPKNDKVIWTEEDYENYEFKDENGEVIEVFSMSKLNNKYLAFETDCADDSVTNTAYIFDVEQKKIVMSEKDDEDDAYLLRFDILDYYDVNNNYIKSNYIGLEKKCVGSCSDYFTKIYTGSLKLLSDNFIDYELKNNTLIIVSNDSVKKYDNKGNLINEISNYNNILSYAKDYILYLDNNTIKVSDTNNDELVVELGTIRSDERIYKGHIYLDENGEYNGIELYTLSDKITYKEALNDMKKDDAYDVAPGFDYEKEEDLKDYDMAYLYTYNFKTNKSTKRAIFLPEDFFEG